MPLGIEGAARAVMRRARRGLFAGKQVLSGNKVSEDGGNRSRRQWKPNVFRKSLYSETLDQMVKLPVTTRAIRCIDKAGGLDAYLVGTSNRKLGSDVGEELRRQILAAQQLRRQAAAVQQAQQQAAATHRHVTQIPAEAAAAART